jgi:large subunit ribosomal protein L9
MENQAMQVILFKNIDNLGMQGQVVNVKNGYYRNYLGPQGLALEASSANLKRMELKRSRLREEAEKQVQEAEAYAVRLEAAPIKFVMKSPDGKRLFGSVHDHEIADQLIAQGFNLERRQVTHEPIKETGKFRVKVTLVGQVEAHVTVTVEAEETKTDLEAKIEAQLKAEAEAAEIAQAETEAAPAEAAEATGDDAKAETPEA